MRGGSCLDGLHLELAVEDGSPRGQRPQGGALEDEGPALVCDVGCRGLVQPLEDLSVVGPVPGVTFRADAADQGLQAVHPGEPDLRVNDPELGARIRQLGSLPLEAQPHADADQARPQLDRLDGADGHPPCTRALCAPPRFREPLAKLMTTSGPRSRTSRYPSQLQMRAARMGTIHMSGSDLSLEILGVGDLFMAGRILGWSPTGCGGQRLRLRARSG